jgi:DNA primase
MILDRVDVTDFLFALGIAIEGHSGENALFLCPWHTDRHPSARMNVNTTAWLCSAGCGKGNAIHFLSMLREMPYEEARDHIYARYGIGPGAAIDDLEAEVRRNLGAGLVTQDDRVLPDESWVQYLAIDWEVEREHPAVVYMLGRGFDGAALNRWQLGYDALSQRITIPVRDHTGKLVGFKARALDPDRQPRYLVIGDGREFRPYGFDTYRKSEYVFGLDRALQSYSGGSIVLVEGELNAIAMFERHNIAAVGMAGSEFSDTQRELVASHYDHAVVYFDDDVYDREGKPRDINPGRRGAAKVASALVPFIDVDVVLHATDDAADADTETVVGMLHGARPAMELALTGELDLAFAT